MKRNMKGSLLAGLALGLGLLVAGCASNNQTEKKAPEVSKSINRELIDWKGSATGADIPDWVTAAINNEFDEMSSSMQKKLENKWWYPQVETRVRKDSKSTKDLKMAQEAAVANYMVSIARSLNAAVDARFNGVLSSNEDSQKTVVATAANARFSGFTKVADYWLLNRSTDSVLDQVTDTYTVVQIYACDEKLFQEQAANYIRDLAGKMPDSEDMKKAAAMADELAASIKPGQYVSK